MKFRTMVIFLFMLTFATSLSAQTRTPTPLPETDNDCAKLAQEWYDSLDPTLTALQSFITALDNDARPTERVRAIDSVRELAQSIEDDRPDDCLLKPHYWYVEGLELFADALEAVVDGNFSDFTGNMADAYRYFGQTRGYLSALGVELMVSEAGSFATK